MTRHSVVAGFSVFAAMVWLVDNVISKQNNFVNSFLDRSFTFSYPVPNIPFVDLSWIVDLWVMLGTLWLLSVFFWITITLCMSSKSRAVQRAMIFVFLMIPVGISTANYAENNSPVIHIHSANLPVADLFERAQTLLKEL
ncbi:hypothetical protein [Marinobacter sp. NSM]|uniref:hypothetical protein n=1 Tax=Marinobacter sp. NSM TaxID=3458004 RepID=UPI00403562A9